MRENEELLFERILLVEDDESHALLIQRALRDFCRRIEVRDNLGEALELLSSFAPQLVITDLKIEGTSSVAHIRPLCLRLGEDIPLLVLTASTSLNDAVEAMKEGARDFIVKNFDREFRDVLGLAITRQHAAMCLREEARRLEQETRALRNCLDNSDDGLALTDQNGAFTYLNPRFKTLLKEASLENRENLGDFLEGCDKDLASRAVAKFKDLKKGASWHSEMKLRGNFFQMKISPLTTSSEHYAAIWLKDVTTIKQKEKFQRELLSTTTHDLKGPLGAISLSAELLQDLVVSNPKASDLILRISSSAQSSINLIDELLSARRIEEGNLILRAVPCDLAEIVERAAMPFSTVANSRGIELKIQKGIESIPIFADPLAIERVAGNLLSNAIKFTPKGGKVEVRVAKSGERVTIEIEDTGSGMEPGEVKHVFGRFQRLERHAQIEGTGIGLFVVGSFVAAHGGNIEVTSQVGIGTCFLITLPVYPPQGSQGQLIALG